MDLRSRLHKQAVADNVTKNASLRLTWQASPRNKVAFWWDEQVTCQRCEGNSGVSFASPLTGGIVVAGSRRRERQPHPDGAGRLDLPREQPRPARGVVRSRPVGDVRRPGAAEQQSGPHPCHRGGGRCAGYRIPGTGRAAWARNCGKMYTYGGSLSYVTGAHRFKVGGRLQQTDAAFVSYYNNARLAYNFSNGLPAQLTMYGNHAATNPFQMNTTALYAQDHWTRRPPDAAGRVRYEQIGSYYPEGSFAADRFIPVALTFPAQDAGVSPKDINPRFGGAYDLFGNGKTSLKFSLGRYPTADNSYGTYGSLQQPAARVATNTNRYWNDLTFPAGDPQARQLLARLRFDESGGQRRMRSLVQPELRKVHRLRRRTTPTCSAAGMSGSTAGISAAGIQQEIAPRTSLEVTYVRRSWGNQTVTDNRAVTAADFDQVQPHGAGRFATAQRRRLSRRGDLRRQTRQVRAGRQLRHLRQELRARAASRPTTAWTST